MSSAKHILKMYILFLPTFIYIFDFYEILLLKKICKAPF